ncbi:bifunctional hydroxymethylpyrimidine kinase/phosphomethylpyrimidine kinase [Pigmentibacter sp. JX0631]|uniref:bifunctional hydroxymethylpyrimidine kinase/phosphomethylpyrimidine kinase n=1 Tax=Pigmentibacter sp. JX0631 TaxID=2976982 RepID=UPI0024685B1B|nr:bifunctional hydroxymethylpyrimidine kinase/phosphomethylpyrimidine kinase [Pigmentibacter sp. JX0631]WGL60137.1 bifunctional hydroxymethylpyrimidine kinase/phosphomethylpyrimidine kinase [Pigmentibacter sp. JX0631]
MQEKNFAFKEYKRLLTIAGSDCSGGAGIQADLKTFQHFECYGMSILTALTAQNTLGVTSIHEIPSEFIAEQFHSILNDIGTDAIKIGMLFSADIIDCVVKCLKKYNCSNIILDPVMLSKNNYELISPEAISALKKNLLPQVNIITPNIPEAEYLLGYSISTKNDMEKAGEDLLNYGMQAVIIKGGHFSSQVFSADCLVMQEKNRIKKVWLETERIKSQNTHGTGCTFSAALAVHLAKEENIEKAFYLAKEYIFQCIQKGSMYKIGKGIGPVCHF